MERVWLAEFSFALKLRESFDTHPYFDRLKVTDEPRFQFSTNHSDQNICFTSLSAQFDQPGFDFFAISRILVTQDHKSHIWFFPSP